MALILGATVARWLFTAGFIWLVFAMIASPYSHLDDMVDLFDNLFSNVDPHYAVTEGLVISSPHRAAIEMDCARASLRKRAQTDFHDHANLRPPKEYQGRYVESVSAISPDSRRGRVEVVFREYRDHSAWPLDVAWTNAGDTLVWEGTCSPQGMYWHFSASLPRAYQRDGPSPQWWLPG